MKKIIRNNFSRILYIIVIIACVYFLYNTKVKSKIESSKEIEKFEQNLEIKDNKDKSVVDLSELDLNMVGVLYVPKIDLTIPVYDSTSEEALSKGVGIIEGTGDLLSENTNTVLTSHNGDSKRELFINLDKLKVGDTFYTKNEKNVISKYEVDSIKTVLPTEEENYWIKDGNTRVTLRTCTPAGINSHRLLVSGINVEYNSNIIPKGKLTLSNFELSLVVIGSLSIILLLLSFIRHRDKKDEYYEEFDWDDY